MLAISKANSEEEVRANCEKLIAAIREIGLQIHVAAEDLLLMQQRDIMLFVHQLFQTIPHYQPKKEPVVFECVLSETVSKQIELNNATQKGISYYVRFEGSSDFLIEETSFKIEPKSTYKFKVHYI